MEASRKVTRAGTLVRILILAAMAQGYLSVPANLVGPEALRQQPELSDDPGADKKSTFFSRGAGAFP